MDLITHKFNTTLFDNVAMTSNQSSAAKDISGISLYALQYVWTGASGTLSIIIEATNVLENTQDADYSIIDNYSIVTATGNRMLNVEKAGYAKVRARIVQTIGTGTLKAIINGKVI